MRKISCALILALSLAGTAARAATVKILEPDEGKTVWTVTIDGIPQPNPNGYQNGVFQVNGLAESVGFSYGTSGTARITQTLVGVLFEDTAGTMISDLLRVTTHEGSSVIQVVVLSDSEQPLQVPTAQFKGLVEDGTYQDLVTVTFPDGTTDVISLQSDVEAVPLPASVWSGLALGGLMAVRVLRNRFRRAA